MQFEYYTCPGPYIGFKGSTGGDMPILAQQIKATISIAKLICHSQLTLAAN